MAYEQKPNTGSLFKNERKSQDTHPDYTGSALIEGIEHYLDAWINADKNGKKYMSIKFKPKQAKSDSFRSGPPDDMNDDIPF